MAHGKEMVMSRLGFIMVCLALTPAAAADEAKLFRSDHVVVSYQGIGEEYGQAIAKTVEAARAAAEKDFGFELPKTIQVKVTASPSGRVRLFTDGNDHLFLQVRSQADLRKPGESGIFHIYGLCHELGHIAMYRLIPDRRWMGDGAADGWAHYAGSRLVDAVAATAGKGLWPDRYDYLEDGTRRLSKQATASVFAPTVRCALLWKELSEIVGEKWMAKVFTAWGKAQIDLADPGAGLRETLLATHEDPRLKAWWNKAEPAMVFKQPRSGIAARTARLAELSGQAEELAHDDGRSAGKKSIAGSGHAVKYAVQGDGWYLTSLGLYGSRYGRAAAPQEDFHVWLCDKDFKVIADFPLPYARFSPGPAQWVHLTVPPTNVPEQFILCVGFNPTATKGVFVHHDGEASGKSLTGLPGREGRAFTAGDWMIRATVDRLKTAEPLTPPQ